MIKVGFTEKGEHIYYYPDNNKTKCIEKLSEWMSEHHKNLSRDEITEIIDEFLYYITIQDNKKIYNMGKKYGFDMDKNDDFEEYSISITSEIFIQTYIHCQCYIKNNDNMVAAEDIFSDHLDKILPNYINTLGPELQSECNFEKFLWKQNNPDVPITEEQILTWKIGTLKHSINYYIRHNLFRKAIDLCKKIGLTSSVKTDNPKQKYFCINIADSLFYFINEPNIIYYLHLNIYV